MRTLYPCLETYDQERVQGHHSSYDPDCAPRSQSFISTGNGPRRSATMLNGIQASMDRGHLDQCGVPRCRGPESATVDGGRLYRDPGSFMLSFYPPDISNRNLPFALEQSITKHTESSHFFPSLSPTIQASSL